MIIEETPPPSEPAIPNDSRSRGFLESGQPLRKTSCRSERCRRCQIVAAMRGEAAARNAIFSRRNRRRSSRDNNSPDVGFETSSIRTAAASTAAFIVSRADARISRLFRRPRFREQNHGEEDAPELLAAELSSPKWKPQVLVMSGVTDPLSAGRAKVSHHAPLPRSAGEVSQPGRHHHEESAWSRATSTCSPNWRITTPSRVNISVTHLDPELQRILEPRTSPPASAIRSGRGNCGGRNSVRCDGCADHSRASTITKFRRSWRLVQRPARNLPVTFSLRLPWAVAPLVRTLAGRTFPRAESRKCSKGFAIPAAEINLRCALAETGGEGIFAEQIESMFEVSCRRAGFGERPKLSTAGSVDRKNN